MKKYELIDETKTVNGKTLYRIQALINFGKVKAGELGGFVESESNLSHEGESWVSGDAQIYGNALVCGEARVSGDARVSGNAQIYGKAWIYDNARVYGV